jgi:hypothetical protein
VTEIDPAVWPGAVTVHVEVAVVAPAAAANVTLAPVLQFVLFIVTLAGVGVMTVLPVHVIAAVTGFAGAAFRRITEVALVPPASVSVEGVQLNRAGGGPAMVNDLSALALSLGVPLSYAVARTVCGPEAMPVRLKL